MTLVALSISWERMHAYSTVKLSAMFEGKTFEDTLYAGNEGWGSTIRL